MTGLDTGDWNRGTGESHVQVGTEKGHLEERGERDIYKDTVRQRQIHIDRGTISLKKRERENYKNRELA